MAWSVTLGKENGPVFLSPLHTTFSEDGSPIISSQLALRQPLYPGGMAIIEGPCEIEGLNGTNTASGEDMSTPYMFRLWGKGCSDIGGWVHDMDTPSQESHSIHGIELKPVNKWKIGIPDEAIRIKHEQGCITIFSTCQKSNYLCRILT